MGEARFETFYSAMHSDKGYIGTLALQKYKVFLFLQI